MCGFFLADDYIQVFIILNILIKHYSPLSKKLNQINFKPGSSDYKPHVDYTNEKKSSKLGERRSDI